MALPATPLATAHAHATHARGFERHRPEDPVVVVVHVEASGIRIMEAATEWGGAHTPTLKRQGQQAALTVAGSVQERDWRPVRDGDYLDFGIVENVEHPQVEPRHSSHESACHRRQERFVILSAGQLVSHQSGDCNVHSDRCAPLRSADGSAPL